MFHDWPSGRGAFYSDNKDKRTMIWCNEEDHMRVICLENGSDLLGVYTRLIKVNRGRFRVFTYFSFLFGYCITEFCNRARVGTSYNMILQFQFSPSQAQSIIYHLLSAQCISVRESWPVCLRHRLKAYITFASKKFHVLQLLPMSYLDCMFINKSTCVRTEFSQAAN